MTRQIHAKKVLEGVKFEAVFDEVTYSEYCFGKCDIDFENENAKKCYLKKFINEELFVFGVIKSEYCKCCNQWKETDSLWGIEAEDGDKAIEYYLNY